MTFLIGTPHASGSGYYMNDDTASGGTKAEADIRTCTHCQAIIKMQQWKVEGAYCAKCSAPICFHCGALAEKFGCVPFNKQLEKALNQDYTSRQRRRLAGLEPVRPSVPLFTGLLTSKD